MSNVISNSVLTADERMAIAIAKAKEARKKSRDEAKLALIDNADYMGYLAMVEDESDEVTRLTTVMETVNKMKPIVTTDGTKYSVHCYPVAEYIFGPIVSRVLGLINASSAMFTDERATEFQALTGVSTLVFNNARDVIGSPAYFSKGNYVSELDGSMLNRKEAMLAVLQGLNLDLTYIDRLSDANISKWFDRAEVKAKEQLAEFSKNEKIDSTSNFTLED